MSGVTQQRRKPEVVYFILCAGAETVKIGIAADPVSRMAQMQTGVSDELMLLGVIPAEHPRALEATLHAKFSADRVRGEWFRCTHEIIDYVEAHGDQALAEFFLRAHEPAPVTEPRDMTRPEIPAGVQAPAGNTRQARMQRYLLARGLTK